MIVDARRVRHLATAALLLALPLVSCSEKHRVLLVQPPEPAQLTPLTFSNYQDQPCWSTRGLIAYRDRGIICEAPDGSYRSDTSLVGIWTLNPETGEKHRIVPFGESPGWSADGNRLAFESGGQIFLVNADGSNVKQITNQGSNFFPAWHPSGTQVTFDSNLGSSGLYDIWIVNTDGSGPHELCTDGAEGRRMGNWAQAGQRFACIQYPTSVSEIFVTDSATCAVTPVTHNDRTDLSPRFSPDGTKIAFYSYAYGQVPQIWLANATGGGERQLTTKGGMWPTWSPDGAKIAYTRAIQTNSAYDGVIWIIELSSGAERQVTSQWPRTCN